MIGILSALAIENCFPKNGLNSLPILLQTTGIGAKNAKIGAQNLIAKGATVLISWGVAGGLSPTLRPGHLVIPDIVMDQQGGLFKTDPEWKKRLTKALHFNLKIHDHPLLHTDQIVSSLTTKQALFIQYEAGALDMESAAIAEIAQKANLPFVVIRAIVDAASNPLPFWFPDIFTADKIHINKFVSQLCRYPQTWLEVFSLFRSFMKAKRTLSLAANSFINSIFDR